MGRKNVQPKKQRNRSHEVYDEDRQERMGFDQLMNADLDELYDRADERQRDYMAKIRKHKFTMLDARAGTGKTTYAVLVAIEMLRKGLIRKIVYVRFVDARYLKQGFLKGYEDEKQARLMTPFLDAMEECGIQDVAVARLIASGVIELTTDSSMRGRNLKDTFLIIDEAQNGDLEDLRLVLTRPHSTRNEKTVVIGHSGQQDGHVLGKTPKYGKRKLNAFQVYQYHMSKKRWTAIAELVTDYRGEVSRHADDVYESLKELEEEC